MQQLLMVDDNEDILTQLKWGLSEAPFGLHFAKNVDEALAIFSRVKPGVVTLDLGLPPHEDSSIEGFRCLEEMLKSSHGAKIIVVTGNDERENALKAIKLGAYDFFRKPINLTELLVIIRRAFHLQELEQENRLQGVTAGEDGSRHGIVGRCRAIKDVIAMVERVAASDVPVLISGESGTGKELVARAIHRLSPRCNGPIVTVNCGAIPENLMESEFFGHERGAFTGAVSTVQGKAEYADKGTLFLDEIGELPPALQVKLLRFLQEMTFQRVGGRKDIEVNVRILAATNIDISRAIQSGNFREDLFYRISVVNIHLPPLRDREGDVMLLADYFLSKIAGEFGKPLKGFAGDATASLKTYSWPGNIRELENKVRRAVVLANPPHVTASDLGFLGNEEMGDNAIFNKTLKEARATLERKMVVAAMAKHDGNILKASEALGVSRPTMYDLLKKYEISSGEN